MQWCKGLVFGPPACCKPTPETEVHSVGALKEQYLRNLRNKIKSHIMP